MSEVPCFEGKPQNKRTNKKTNRMNSDISPNWVYPECYWELVLDIGPILRSWKYFFGFQMLGKNQIQNGESGVCITNLSTYVDVSVLN